MEKGCDVRFSTNEVEIWLKDNLLFSGIKRNNLYVVRFQHQEAAKYAEKMTIPSDEEIPQPTINSLNLTQTSTDSLVNWHQRLNHLNCNDIKKMTKVVDGMIINLLNYSKPKMRLIVGSRISRNTRLTALADT